MHIQSIIDNLTARYWNKGPRNELGARRAEQYPHIGNYTLIPGWLNTKMVRAVHDARLEPMNSVTHPSTNRVRRRTTTLLETNALPLYNKQPAAT